MSVNISELFNLNNINILKSDFIQQAKAKYPKAGCYTAIQSYAEGLNILLQGAKYYCLNNVVYSVVTSDHRYIVTQEETYGKFRYVVTIKKYSDEYLQKVKIPIPIQRQQKVLCIQSLELLGKYFRT